MSTAARQRTPATDALRAIQAPVRDRLELVVHEMHTIVSSDLPMIDTQILEIPNPNHPYGVRGVGETSIVPPLAAIAAG